MLHALALHLCYLLLVILIGLALLVCVAPPLPHGEVRPVQDAPTRFGIALRLLCLLLGILIGLALPVWVAPPLPRGEVRPVQDTPTCFGKSILLAL